MKPSKSISGITHRYPMGMHLAMQDQLYGLIHPIAAEKIALEPTDIPGWKADIEQERELVRETTAAEETVSIIEKDKKRDEVITSIFQEVRLADKSLIEARHTAGHRLRLVVDTYKGLQTENKIEETGHITGLLNDRYKPAAASRPAPRPTGRPRHRCAPRTTPRLPRSSDTSRPPISPPPLMKIAR